MPKLPSDAETSQVRMTFGEHLDELRKRILRALIGSLLGVGLCLYFYKEILEIVTRPYVLVAQAHNLPGILTTLKPQEAFLTTITLAFQCGLIISSPWIIYQLWQFVAAGLFQRERKIVYRYTAPSALLFLTGVAFFYFIVLPMTLNFFMTFTSDTASSNPTPNFIERFLHIGAPATTQPASTQTASAPATRDSVPGAVNTPDLSVPALAEPPPAPPPGEARLYLDTRDHRLKVRLHDKTFTLLVSEEGSLFSNTWRYDDYLSFVTFTALVFGLAFELPMVIMILAQVGLVQVQTFRNVRKYAYFGILIAAVIAAPAGDLMTLMFLWLPLIALYELGILAAAIVTGRKPRTL